MAIMRNFLKLPNLIFLKPNSTTTAQKFQELSGMLTYIGIFETLECSQEFKIIYLWNAILRLTEPSEQLKKIKWV